MQVDFFGGFQNKGRYEKSKGGFNVHCGVTDKVTIVWFLFAPCRLEKY